MKIIDNYKKINKLIDDSSSVFIVGHKDLDLDALGACLAMYNYSVSLNKEAYIIVDDKHLEMAVSKVIKYLGEHVLFLESEKAFKLKNGNSLLIVIDTNKNYLLQNPSIAQEFETKIIIDHHEQGAGTMVDEKLVVIDTEASSTCEMMTEFLKLNKYTIDSELATILLSGIILDTNNYVLKTDMNTFYYSYFLTTCGAKPNKVQYLLKQDLNKYIKRQQMITNTKIINNIAITKGENEDVYRREELAKAADTLLLFNGIEASFVIAKTEKDIVGVSARSLGNINVGQILSLLNGGGDAHEAAAKVSNTNTSDLEKEIINIIKLL